MAPLLDEALLNDPDYIAGRDSCGTLVALATAGAQEGVGAVGAGQRVVKIGHDVLVNVLGGETVELVARGKPGVIFLVGLQGAGKTTTAAKLANHIRSKYSK